MKISKIILYDEPSVPEIKIRQLKNFLETTFPVNVEVRDSILESINKDKAVGIARCRIYDTKKPFEKHIPSKDEIVSEENISVSTANSENIVMYDGFELLQAMTDLIPRKEQGKENFYVIFTNKLTCTFDYTDYRYHGRALIGANPSVISTTGIIEAPAKPRNYYLDLINNYRQGLNIELIKKKYKGGFLEYNDSRLSKIIEGYLLQALFYFETEEAFCENKDCRLFNAHWQKDLLYSQIKMSKLCEKHKKILKEFQN